MSFRTLLVAAFMVASAATGAQQPAPAGMSLAEAASRRFPQPVQVGALLKRQVLQPLESQPTLGWVEAVVKQADGSIDVVVDYGGFRGLFSRAIAVPLDAMVVLGPTMEIVDFTPVQLAAFKTFEAGESTPLPPDSVVKVGLARPSH